MQISWYTNCVKLGEKLSGSQIQLQELAPLVRENIELNKQRDENFSTEGPVMKVYLKNM